MSEPSLTRRAMLARSVAAGAALMLGARRLRGQDPQLPQNAGDSSNLFSMDQMAARPVALPPKPNARPLLTAAERDALEHRIKCQCGCTLDVYTCRTTDFSCQVSPSMHRDVVALVDGGYSAQEIIDAFTKTYGEQVLMAPKAEGFNLLGWTLPFIALAGAIVAVGVLIRRWGSRAAVAPAGVVAPPSVDASPDELRRLEAAIRDDE